MLTYTMWLSFLLVCIFSLTFTKGQLDTYEVQQINVTPLHDAIIFNDIADIISDFENDISTQVNKNMFSDSESDEDIDELLSEYQHYLDKAHKQRMNYIEKSKVKNKVPLVHHEKYTKMKGSTRNKYDFSNDYYNKIKTLSDPLKLFMPDNSKRNQDNKSELTDRSLAFKGTLLNLIPTIPNLSNKNINKPISSCYCKENEIPCKCSCKQCFILTNSLPYNQNIMKENFPKSSKIIHENKMHNFNDDKINLRIKIDVKLPKILSEFLHKYQNHDEEGILYKEFTSPINLPLEHFNFPFPIGLIRHKKMYDKYDNNAMQKFTIHKKKKSHLSNNSKNHTGKKIITFSDNNNKDQPTEYNISNLITKNSSVDSNNSEFYKSISHTNKPLSIYKVKTQNVSYNSPTEIPFNQTIYLTVNITKNNNEKDTNDSLKIENSIETDFDDKRNKTSVKPLRLKREVLEKNITTVTQISTKIPAINVTPLVENYKKEAKKFNKTTVEEDELLYWPIQSKNVTFVKSKNITAVIVERETKKAKLNITDNKMRNNRTSVLEHAIFGDVNWDDIDTIAPVFMSFVGKYINGILTFCSQSVCHSMKCSEKTCIHRICTPSNRFNSKGHCTGNKETDSVAAMESIMDLPSNIGFEIVNILEDKMIGKIYGKATLCIMSKCTTFVTSKKKFLRSKCTNKDLSLGHCRIEKNVNVT
ncbi:myb-like protein F [Bicyclus anynana]|uniref:Myb-like protein F n=1 Tax=Bicyclus anynana TaxID=110368 RepID=A0ABM3LQQ2_BICAN|nr:myb-like protein F [Bicyclus anynana]